MKASCRTFRMFVLVTFVGSLTIRGAQTNSVQSKSYLEALESFRATPAYQNAAVDLFAREAKWVAERVGIDEPIGSDPNDVEPPKYGLGGSVGGTNYSFSFSQGRFK